jgi:hypothetical protein
MALDIMMLRLVGTKMKTIFSPYRKKDLEESPALTYFFNQDIIEQVDYVRDLISKGLKTRKIKLRQPLNKVTVITKNPYCVLKWEEDFYREWNIDSLHIVDMRCLSKNINQEDLIEFNLELTENLKERGWLSDFKRVFQNYRKAKKLSIEDRPKVNFSFNDIIYKYKEEIEKDVNIIYESTIPLKEKIKIEDVEIDVGIKLDP